MPIATVPLLIGGRQQASASSRRGEVFNPSTGRVQAEVPLCTAEEIDRAVQAAAAALPAWSETPVVERARVMFRFRELLQAHFEELAALVTREHGKTLAEARAEVQRGIEMVEFACGIPSLLMGQTLPEHRRRASIARPAAIRSASASASRRSTFPSMVPLWMFPVAITCGNTFVLKPSEKVPLSAMRLGELLTEAGLPPGVFNIVHGDKTCVDALLDASAGAGDFVRRLDRRRQVHLRNGHAARQARAGGRRREEPSDHHARRRPRPGGEGAPGARPSAAPASGAWPAASPCRSARSPTDLVEGLCDHAGAR